MFFLLFWDPIHCQKDELFVCKQCLTSIFNISAIENPQITKIGVQYSFDISECKSKADHRRRNRGKGELKRRRQGKLRLTFERRRSSLGLPFPDVEDGHLYQAEVILFSQRRMAKVRTETGRFHAQNCGLSLRGVL